MHNLAGAAVIHSPTGACEADVVGVCGLLVDGVRSGESEGSIVGDQHLPRAPIRFGFLVAAEPTLPLVGKRGAELVLQDDVGEFVEHGGAPASQGLSIVLQDDRPAPRSISTPRTVRSRPLAGSNHAAAPTTVIEQTNQSGEPL